MRNEKERKIKNEEKFYKFQGKKNNMCFIFVFIAIVLIVLRVVFISYNFGFEFDCLFVLINLDCIFKFSCQYPCFTLFLFFGWVEKTAAKVVPYFEGKFLYEGAAINGGNAISLFVNFVSESMQLLGCNVPKGMIYPIFSFLNGLVSKMSNSSYVYCKKKKKKRIFLFSFKR